MYLSIIFSGLILIILLLAYTHINKKSSILIRGINIFQKSKESNTANIHTSYYMRYFKKVNGKRIIVLLIGTLIFAYILYNSLFFAVVLSNSMMPVFERGDMVLMQTYNITPEVGDIMMFNVQKLGKDDIVTHRIYSISKNGIRTKGDATALDNWVIHERDIMSKVVIVGGKPIVVKGVGYYFLDETPTTTYSGEFGFIQTILMKAKEIGLLIFVVCIVMFILLSVNDSMKQKRLRRN